MGVGVSRGGVDVAPGLRIKLTVIVTGEPADGVITTVALYVPGGSAAIDTGKESDDDAWEASRPLPGVTLNQVCEGFPAVQSNVSPPMLVNTRS